MTSSVLAFSFPNPFALLGKVLSPLLDLGGAVIDGIVGTVIGGLAGAVVGALADLTASVLGFFIDAAEPELTSSWFYGQGSPYQTMVLLSLPLLVAFFLAGVIQGVMRGDTAGMLRMTLLRLPGSVLAMSIAVVLADVLLKATDEMSHTLLSGFRDDIEQVGVVLGSLALSGSIYARLLVLVFGVVGLLAAVLLVVELFVRAALLYLLAAFSPLIYAASVWEPMRGSLRKLGEMALALIISKLAIAAALAVSAAALVAVWPGSGATAITTPEQAAIQEQQSVAQTVGVLVSAIIMWVVAAFMPFVLWRLLPMAEGAAVAQGVRGAPFRSAHLGASAATMAVRNPATSALKAKAGAGAGGATGAAAAVNPASGVAAAAGSVVKKGTKAAKDRVASAADRQSAGASGQARSGGGSGSSRSGRRDGGRASSSKGTASGNARGQQPGGGPSAGGRGSNVASPAERKPPSGRPHAGRPAGGGEGRPPQTRRPGRQGDS